jgi:chromosome segregation protein
VELTGLRIVGFKSFVEPVEAPLEPGLTGIVGPNGCGKSNLVDALRWVLGESSHKTMRASGADDLIFSGSAERASRNTAEVCLVLDNSSRAAPAAFHAEDELEVVRRIQRGHGSRYEVNGREVPARDVQLMFADVATGARSSSLVRQGQVAELLSAKPQARRRILEDAAGLAGVAARRHEAELRLAQTDDNLLRVEAVLREMADRVDGLRRQSDHAARYRAVSAELRATEAMLAAIGYADAHRELMADEARVLAAAEAVAGATAAQTEAASDQATATSALEAARRAERDENEAGGRAVSALNERDREERRAKERLLELTRRIVDLERDAAVQAQAGDDASATLDRLRAEGATLARDEDEAVARGAALAATAGAAERALAGAEAACAASRAVLADMTARGSTLEAALAAEREGMRRLAAERERLDRDLAALAVPPDDDRETLRSDVATLAARWRDLDGRAVALREAVAAARDEEARQRSSADEAEGAALRLEAELQALTALSPPEAGSWPTMLDCARPRPGYELALVAALGGDLAGSPDEAAPVHWIETGYPGSDPALPGLVRSLAEVVEGPPALRRSLRQVGIVEAREGAKLAAFLRPGQRLVSREGDVWRWDGFVAAAAASSHAAGQSARTSRLAGLAREAAEARDVAARHHQLSSTPKLLSTPAWPRSWSWSGS